VNCCGDAPQRRDWVVDTRTESQLVQINKRYYHASLGIHSSERKFKERKKEGEKSLSITTLF
jgi:hypothetical protein